MGWWSATILGGDAPYDYRGAFIDLMGCDDSGPRDTNHFWFGTYTIRTYRKKMNENLEKIYNRARKYDEEAYYVGVPGQVLGAMILELGAKMPKKVRKFIIESAEKDDWAKQDEERKKYIDDFIEKVKAYPERGGKVVELAREGLMGKIEEHLSKGKEGLVNR